MLKKLISGVIALVALLGLGWYLIARGFFGSLETGGEVTDVAIPDAAIEQRTAAQQAAANRLSSRPAQQILFGDLHVHTTYSFDAFIGSLPMMQGEGAHPVADACDFARFCSALDFWSINDHAEASTARRWRETVDAIQQCNAVGGGGENPDTVAFLGWEWTQVGATPDQHYGHKNVIFRSIDDARIPARPIHSGGLAATALRGLPLQSAFGLVALDPGRRTLDFAAYLDELRQSTECPPNVPVRELPVDCRESAPTPAGLFAKLDDWGFESIVIPHGTTWGFYTPATSSWDKQLAGDMHDADRQTLLEVYSGHGNSEEYRSFRAATWDAQGQPACPPPSDDYLPSCHRAGEIIRERCIADGESDAECERRAAMARIDYVNGGNAGHLAIRGEHESEWLDAGQCRDCYLPSFNYRPASSAQYIMALGNFDLPGSPRRFRFGFMASSDNHRARPGTGYKEFYRQGMTESTIGPRNKRAERAFREPEGPPDSRSYALDFDRMGLRIGDIERAVTDSPVLEVDVAPFMILERERQASFFTTGGLIAAHADGRDRDAIWESWQRKEVYGTSGDRILLWFDMLNADDGERVAMGSETEKNSTPRFEVRAIGAFRQNPGCPDYTVNAMSPERLDRLCRGECYNPSDERKLITRVEVIRILPQQSKSEAIEKLISDPWKTLPCPPDPDGCTVQFEDADYADNARDAVYYVRAVQEPSLAVNAANLRCEYDDEGNCIKVDPCYGGWQTPVGDDCLAPTEERAWSSPIFVDWNTQPPEESMLARTKAPAPET